jgi:hypothetical protein
MDCIKIVDDGLYKRLSHCFIVMLPTICVTHQWNLSLSLPSAVLSQFFGWQESDIHPFLSRSLSDYFYEYKATQKILKLKFRTSILLRLTRYAILSRTRLYDFVSPFKLYNSA